MRGDQPQQWASSSILQKTLPPAAGCSAGGTRSRGTGSRSSWACAPARRGPRGALTVDKTEGGRIQPWEGPAYRCRMHPMAAKHPLRHLLALGPASGLAGLIVADQSPPKTAFSRVSRGVGRFRCLPRGSGSGRRTSHPRSWHSFRRRRRLRLQRTACPRPPSTSSGRGSRRRSLWRPL